MTSITLTDRIDAMQTIEQYAEQVAAGDRGRWRAATLRAVELVSHRQPTVDLTARLPLTQILLQTTTLITVRISRNTRAPTPARPATDGERGPHQA